MTRATVTIESEFPTVEAWSSWRPWAWWKGLTQAVGQLDAILAEDPVEAP